MEIDGGEDDEIVDRSTAMASDPIIGMDRVTHDDSTGPGAIPARVLPSPKGMTSAERAIHDVTHLPYDPSCEVCTSRRRPNTPHRTVSMSERTLPLMVGDYAFPKHFADADTITLLVIRVYPYKLVFSCVVPSKGRHPDVVNRLTRFIKECGLTQFTYRSDLEPSIMAMMGDAVGLFRPQWD